MEEFPKRCTLCGTVWASAWDLVWDEELRVEGYQASLDGVENGLILVTHTREGCGTTLALPVSAVGELYLGPRYAEALTGTEECEGLCLDENRLDECGAPCSLAWVRTVLQYLREHRLPAPVLQAS